MIIVDILDGAAYLFEAGQPVGRRTWKAELKLENSGMLWNVGRIRWIWRGKNKEIEDQRFLVYNKEKAVNGIMLTETGGAKQWKKAYGASL